MLRYTLRRLIIGAGMLLALTVLIFILLRLTPGDPIDAYLDPNVSISQAEMDALRARLGLDQPLPVQYFAWLGQAVQGNLGYSLQRFNEPVAGLIAARIGPTLLLMGAGLAHRHRRRHRRRHHRRGPPQLPARPLALGPRARRHLQPGLPHRAPRPLCLLGPARLGALRRHADPGRRLLARRPPAPPDPAGGGALHRPCRADHALHARLAARSAEPGLRPHRPRQGRPRVLGHHQARARATRCCRSSP